MFSVANGVEKKFPANTHDSFVGHFKRESIRMQFTGFLEIVTVCTSPFNSNAIHPFAKKCSLSSDI